MLQFTSHSTRLNQDVKCNSTEWQSELLITSASNLLSVKWWLVTLFGWFSGCTKDWLVKSNHCFSKWVTGLVCAILSQGCEACYDNANWLNKLRLIFYLYSFSKEIPPSSIKHPMSKPLKILHMGNQSSWVRLGHPDTQIISNWKKTHRCYTLHSERLFSNSHTSCP